MAKENIFIQGLHTSYEDVVEKVDGASYVTWAAVLARAGRPRQSVVDFEGRLFLEIFGGAVVAVDTEASGVTRRCWLPVLDAKNAPIPASKLDVRALNDAIARCRAKSVAMATGHSLSYYAEGMSASKFLEALGELRPESDPAVIAPFESKKMDKNGKVKAAYLGWPAAIAAASITDPTFTWEIGWGQVADKATGELVSMPYMDGPGGGYMVAVRVNWRGTSHTEYLPILGIDTVQTKHGPKRMEHRPNLNPTAADWNASVMRCLAKAVAVCTGYGLSLYAGEDLERLIAPKEADEVEGKAEAAKAATAAQEAPGDLVGKVQAAIKETSTEVAALFRHFGVEGTDLSAVPEATLQRMLEALEAKKRRMVASAKR